MDNNNQNTTPDQSDLSNQYNDILEKYSQQLAASRQNENSSPADPEPVKDAPVEPSEPVLVIPPTLPPESPEVFAPPAPEPPPTPIIPPTPTYEPAFTPPPEEIPMSPPVKKGSSFFKILFFISLLIFLGVAGTIAYTLFFQPKPDVNLTLDPNISTSPEPSVPQGPTCDINDKKYVVGETFTATDGCNTCTCDENLMISCTEKACPSVTPGTALIPADSETPASGICSEINTKPLVNIVVGKEGVSEPRCTKVTENQLVSITNKSTKPIDIKIGEKTENILVGKTYQFTKKFGQLFAPGIHQFAGAEVWLTK